MNNLSRTGEQYFVNERVDTDYTQRPPVVTRHVTVRDSQGELQLPEWGVVERLTSEQIARMVQAQQEGARFFTCLPKGLFSSPIDIGLDREVYLPLNIHSGEFRALSSNLILSSPLSA